MQIETNTGEGVERSAALDGHIQDKLAGVERSFGRAVPARNALKKRRKAFFQHFPCSSGRSSTASTRIDRSA